MIFLKQHAHFFFKKNALSTSFGSVSHWSWEIFIRAMSPRKIMSTDNLIVCNTNTTCVKNITWSAFFWAKILLYGTAVENVGRL